MAISDKLFARKEVPVELNYAVTLLIDQSGSMEGSKIVYAQACGILLAEVMDRLGVAFEVMGFTSKDLESKQADYIWHPDCKCREPGTCDEPVHYMYKSFDEPYSDEVKARMGTIKAYSNNYDGTAVRFAGKRLLKRPESKILFVISDGNPAGHYAQPVDLKKVVEQMSSHMAVIGVGICIYNPKEYYKNWMQVDNIETLGLTILRKIEHIIYAARYRK